MPIAPQQNPAVDFADIFSKVAPYFVGTPGSDTTTNTSSSTDPVTAAIMQSILGNIGDGSGFSKDAAIADSQGPVANLVQQALQSQMPGITSAGKASGLYNSTTQAQLTNDLAARTQLAGSQAVQQNIQNYANIQTNQLDAATKAALVNQQKTTTTAAKPPIDLSSLLLKTGIGLGANYLGKKALAAGKDLFGPSAPAENSITATQAADDADALTPDTQGLSANSSVDVSNAVGTGADEFTATEGTGGLSESLADGVSAGSDVAEGFSAADSLAADTGGLSEFGGGVGADAAVDTGADAAAGIGADAGVDAAADIGADAAVDVGVDAAADAGGADVIGDVATAALSAVICTESVRQGLMDPRLYHDEARIMGEKLSAASIRGYHHIAPYWVLRMRRDKRTAKRLASWACAYADFIVNGRVSVTSALLHYLGRPICFLIGSIFQEEPDISHLRVGV